MSKLEVRLQGFLFDGGKYVLDLDDTYQPEGVKVGAKTRFDGKKVHVELDVQRISGQSEFKVIEGHTLMDFGSVIGMLYAQNIEDIKVTIDEYELVDSTVSGKSEDVAIIKTDDGYHVTFSLSIDKNNEQIMIIPRNKLFGESDELAFQGFAPITDLTIQLDQLAVDRRGDLETDPTNKQLITYAIIQDKESKDLLLYKRLGGSGEQRLVDKTSIGVGGHSNMYDSNSVDELLYENFIRELHEELQIESEMSYRKVGYINDDANEVGEVHLGVVYVVEVDKTKVAVNETDTLEIEWLTADEIAQDTRLETWSQLLIADDEFKAELGA